MKRVALLNIVGLSADLIGTHTPRIRAFAERTGGVTRLSVPFPAVTTTVQTSMLTGVPVARHGIVGNGWYDRIEGEVKFWKQSQRFVEAKTVWQKAREMNSEFTCANVCWWYAMNSDVDVYVTPRPIYRANGRKVPDCQTRPPELRDELTKSHGAFPLFRFWGPGADIESTRWIVDAAIHVSKRSHPTLQLVYLPHLDYGLQKLGPGHEDVPRILREVDEEVGRLIDALEHQGVEVLLVSEYGIVPVNSDVPLNKTLREAGLISIREELGTEMLIPTECEALAIADHQIAHVYVRDRERRDEVARLLRAVDGVDSIVPREESQLDHPRSGDLIATANSDRWFSYDWWLNDAVAPDYARTVDIHNKPGYDPRELFLSSRLRAAGKLALTKTGVRTTMDVIPLDGALVKGSHGRKDHETGCEPILIGLGRTGEELLPCERISSILLERIFED